MKLKLDIENKILIPFMILTILPITILGIVSYWNGYQLLFNERVNTQRELLNEAVLYLESVNEEVGRGEITAETGKAKALDYFRKADEKNMAILGPDGYMMGNSELFPEDLKQRTAENKGGVLDEKKMRYIFADFRPWGWTVIFGVDKSLFPEELITIQKYTMLLAIIFLVLSMQAIIFIAHNISKPIKYFAEICKKIEIGNLEEKVNILRGDEIGVLANSFNRMVDQINASTGKLIEMQKFNEDILKSIDIGIMTTDNNGKMVTINMAGNEILAKYGEVNLLETLNCQILDTISHLKTINEMISINVSAGKAIYIDVITSLLKKEDGAVYGAICSFNDITERKVLENNIIRVDRLASVGHFAAGLAHEIRNPLTGLKTGLQVIKHREVKRNEIASQALIEGLTFEIDRINSLVSDLLDFSRPKQTIREKAEIKDIIKKSLDLAMEEIVVKSISVALTADEPFQVFVDKRQVEQIFLNIITNAIEAMEPKGHLTIEVKRAFIDDVSFIQISFEDDGAGIEAEILGKIFDPFFTTKVKGTGLGLVVVAKLVEENHGKIEIESVLKEGTKIKVSLPEYWRVENENEGSGH
ncbi:MAG TPA: ATP-binding protein [Bacillota bacterium]|nr:ATP-binding protein [Bacillota bacterium]